MQIKERKNNLKSKDQEVCMFQHKNNRKARVSKQ